jgi:hypothetical protein
VLERGDRLKLVRFSIAGTIYAFEVDRVEEVVQPLAITRATRATRVRAWAWATTAAACCRSSTCERASASPPSASSRASKWVLTKLPLEGRAELLRIRLAHLVVVAGSQ